MAVNLIQSGEKLPSNEAIERVCVPHRDLFKRRADRFRQLSVDHPLQDYLLLMAMIADCQQELLDDPLSLNALDDQQCAQSQAHEMPPLAFETRVREGLWLPMLDAFLERFTAPDDLGVVTEAIEQLRQAKRSQRIDWAHALLNGYYDRLNAAHVPFLGAALQCAWSHWLLSLPEGALDVGDSTLCPACGSMPVAGQIRAEGKQDGLRYLVCSLCSCAWHFVRIKCSNCRGTRNLSYLSLEQEGQAPERAALRAETCPECQHYLKQFYMAFDKEVEVMADDLASLGLDIRLADEGYLRSAPNLLMAPGDDER